MTIQINAINNVADKKCGKDSDLGIDESQVQSIIELALVRYPSKAVCAIKDWRWWDFDVSQEARAQYEATGVQSAVLFASHLIWDSRGRRSKNWNIKTTPLVVFEENCLFITWDTVYILVGSGHRKTADPQLAATLHFYRG